MSKCHDCSCHINPPCGRCENCKHLGVSNCLNDCQECEYHHLARWGMDKPFSGRLVYKTVDGRAWTWQCDMHDIIVGPYHDFPTHSQALENALVHAKNCPERNC